MGVLGYGVLLLIGAILVVLLIRVSQTNVGATAKSLAKLHKIKHTAIQNYPEWKDAVATLVVTIDRHAALVYFDFTRSVLGLLYEDATFETIEPANIRESKEVVLNNQNSFYKLAIHVYLWDGRIIEADFLQYPADIYSERLKRLGNDAANFNEMVEVIKARRMEQ